MAAKTKKPVKSRSKRPPKTELVQLATETVPAEPGISQGLTNVWLPRKIGGMIVTEQVALTCASVWACVRVISEGLAKLPWRAFEKLGDDRNEASDHPSDWLLQVQANPETAAFQFRETIVAHALTWGNGYAEVERTITGKPVWIWQITPDRVCVDRDSRGRIVYDVRNHNESNTVLESKDMFHLKGLGFDGLVGYSVIAMASKTIACALSAETAAADIWENDSTPGGVLETSNRLSDLARANIRKTWTERHGGAKNRRKLAILEEGLKWVATMLPPEDSQLLASRQYTPLEVCRIFRVQPHKIAELTRATFSNITEQNQEHVDDTLLPWAVRCEQEANLKLIAERDQRKFYTKYNFDALLRGKSTERADVNAKLFMIGALTINEIRAKEDLNPIGPDGDKRFVPLNMVLLEKAGEEPPAPTVAPPTQAPAPAPDGKKADPNAENMGIARDLLGDAIGRVVRRELHRLDDAAKRLAGNMSAADKWYNEFAVEQVEYVCSALAKPVAAAARLAGCDCGEVPQSWVKMYELAAKDRAALCFAGKNSFDADELAARYADELLSAICYAGGPGSGPHPGDGKGKVAEENPSAKAERAKAAHKMVDKTIQRYAEERNEPYAAKQLGGKSEPDNKPYDIAVNKGDKIQHGVELKTMVDNKNDKITMKGSAQDKKVAWEKENKATFHTVVYNDQKVFNANGPGKHDDSKRELYYRRGGGSFRVGGMYKAKDHAELKTLMNTPNDKLPPAARATPQWEARQKAK